MIDRLVEIAGWAEDYLRSREKTLKDIRSEAPEVLKVLNGKYREMKELVISGSFDSVADEVRFFEELKPRLCSHIIYYQRVSYICLNKPTSGAAKEKEYLLQMLNYMDSYNALHEQSVHYYRARKTCFDHLFFVRDPEPSAEFVSQENSSFERDPRFAAHSDQIFATIMAHDRLEVFIRRELNKLEYQKKTELFTSAEASPLFWTNTKIALAELIYALHLAGCLNHGDVELKHIARIFEHVFNIRFGDIYDYFRKIRERKTGRTIFLFALSSAVEGC